MSQGGPRSQAPSPQQLISPTNPPTADPSNHSPGERRPSGGRAAPPSRDPPAPGPSSPLSPRSGLGSSSKAAAPTPGFLDGGGPCHVAPSGRQPAHPRCPLGPRCPPGLLLPRSGRTVASGLSWPPSPELSGRGRVTRLVTDTASSPTRLWVLSRTFASGPAFPRRALHPDPLLSPRQGLGRPQGARLCAGQPQASLTATWGRVSPPCLRWAPQGRDPQCFQHLAEP